MSYISIDSNDIQAGVDSKNILEDVQEVIYELSVYDYKTAKLKLREGIDNGIIYRETNRRRKHEK